MHLPKAAKWQLIDPRIFCGLLGGDDPPFGVMEINFSTRLGTCWYGWKSGTISNMTMLGIGKFTAGYTFGSKTGEFEATLRDDGYLMLKFSGDYKDETYARPLELSVWSPKRMAVLTCVGNPGWPGGPGHSGLVADHMTFNFQIVNMTGHQSGWEVEIAKDYFNKSENRARPIVIQELNMELVSAEKAMTYIQGSMLADEDYASSGVCSQQAANALSAAVKSFSVGGIDTPLNLYQAVKAHGFVTRSYYLWHPSESGDLQSRWLEEISEHFYGEPMSTGPSCLGW